MRWLIIYFLRNLEKTMYIMLLIGFIAGGVSCAASELTCSNTIRGAIPIAITINSILLVYFYAKVDKKAINRAELLNQYVARIITTKDLLNKHGILMSGCCILLFWAGWFYFGILSAVLTILFEGR